MNDHACDGRYGFPFAAKIGVMALGIASVAVVILTVSVR